MRMRRGRGKASSPRLSPAGCHHPIVTPADRIGHPAARATREECGDRLHGPMFAVMPALRTLTHSLTHSLAPRNAHVLLDQRQCPSRLPNSGQLHPLSPLHLRSFCESIRAASRDQQPPSPMRARRPAPPASTSCGFSPPFLGRDYARPSCGPTTPPTAGLRYPGGECSLMSPARNQPAGHAQ